MTDLAFRAYLDWLRVNGEIPAILAAQRLTKALRAADRLHVLVGLTLGDWEEHLGRCFLQVTGVYSFPDYLAGRCYADFFPPPPEPALNLADVPFCVSEFPTGLAPNGNTPCVERRGTRPAKRRR